VGAASRAVAGSPVASTARAGLETARTCLPLGGSAGFLARCDDDAAMGGRAALATAGTTRAGTAAWTTAGSAVPASTGTARRHTRPNTTTSSFSVSGAIRHQVDGSPM
jgi:hypothetical protein